MWVPWEQQLSGMSGTLGLCGAYSSVGCDGIGAVQCCQNPLELRARSQPSVHGFGMKHGVHTGRLALGR